MHAPVKVPLGFDVPLETIWYAMQSCAQGFATIVESKVIHYLLVMPLITKHRCYHLAGWEVHSFTGFILASGIEKQTNCEARKPVNKARVPEEVDVTVSYSYTSGGASWLSSLSPTRAPLPPWTPSASHGTHDARGTLADRTEQVPQAYGCGQHTAWRGKKRLNLHFILIIAPETRALELASFLGLHEES